MKVHKHKAIKMCISICNSDVWRDLSNIKQVLTTLSAYSKEVTIKTPQNKKVVLLYTHFFYALVNLLQYIHFASKNFISTEYVILLFLPFFYFIIKLYIPGILYLFHYMCISPCEGQDLKPECSCKIHPTILSL